MGKATILSNYGKGKYQVRVEYNTAAHDARIAQMVQDIEVAAALVVSLEAELSVLEEGMESSLSALDAAITEGDQAKIQKVVASIAKEQSEFLQLQTKKNGVELVKIGLEKQKKFLEDNVKGSKDQIAWCADYSEELSGEVGTIELGLSDEMVIIKPAGCDGVAAGHSPEADGQLMEIMAMGPASAFINYALRPGQAKWHPRYRAAILTNISKENNTGDIALETLTAEDLDLNEKTNFTGVPIEYLCCNSGAFEDGDRVIAEFTDGVPKVIGFVDNPRPCGGTIFLFQGQHRFILWDFGSDDYLQGYTGPQENSLLDTLEGAIVAPANLYAGVTLDRTDYGVNDEGSTLNGSGDIRQLTEFPETEFDTFLWYNDITSWQIKDTNQNRIYDVLGRGTRLVRGSLFGSNHRHYVNVTAINDDLLHPEVVAAFQDCHVNYTAQNAIKRLITPEGEVELRYAPSNYTNYWIPDNGDYISYSSTLEYAAVQNRGYAANWVIADYFDYKAGGGITVYLDWLTRLTPDGGTMRGLNSVALAAFYDADFPERGTVPSPTLAAALVQVMNGSELWHDEGSYHSQLSTRQYIPPAE